jgi:hypothetical protein
MSYEVKGVKTLNTDDGFAYSATLYRDGIKVAVVNHDGFGGEPMIHWDDYKQSRVTVDWVNDDGNPFQIERCTPEEAKLYEFLRGKTWTMEDCGEKFEGKKFQVGLAHYIDELVTDFDNDKRFKRMCKNSTLYRLKGSDKGSWTAISTPFTQKMKDELVAKHGDKLEEILNERYGGVVAEDPNRWLKKLCKNKTVVHMKGEASDRYATFNAPFSAAIKQRLLAKYGDKIDDWVNERLAV